MRPILRSGIAGCILLTSALWVPFANAQGQYGDSAWTGQTNYPQQQRNTAQPTTAHQPTAQLPATRQQQQVAQPGYPDSSNQPQNPVYGGLPNAPVITASAQGPANESFDSENTGVPPGRPISTGTELTPINGADRESAASDSSGGVLQTIVSVGSSLLIVGGLFFGLVWVYRKTANTTMGGGLPKGVVNVLGRAPIAARQQMVLVRFGNKLVLVSVVQGDARMISEITDPLEVDRLTGLCESAKPDSSVQSFRSFLSEGSKA